MKELWRFVKTSGIYFMGTVLTKLITFLLLPIYTAYIDPDGMGIYDVATAYVTFLCSVVYLDIWSAVMRFTYEYSGTGQKKPISNGAAIFVCSTLVYSAIMLGVYMIFHVEYMLFIYFYGLLANMQYFCGYVARTQGKNVLYAAGGIAGSLVTILANIILLVGFRMDYSALFLSSCVGYIANILILVIGAKINRLISVSAYEKSLFKQMFIFSLPLCVNSVAYWFLSSYNRVAITNVLGTAANGMYSIAGRFGSFITLFTSCFTMAWQEISYSKEAKGMEDQSGFYTSAVNSYIRFLGMGLIMIVPVVYVIYPIMINESYAPGKSMVPLYLMATVASAVSSFLGNIFTAIKKNDLLFYTTVVGSVVNVLTVHLLLPIMGVQGASIALFLGFGINCVIRIKMLQKYLGFTVEWKFLIAFVLMFAIAFGIYNFGNLWMNIAVCIVGAVITLLVFREPLTKILGNIKDKMEKG